MSEFLPPELRLASHDDISEVVGVIVRKLGSVSSHAEMPKRPIVLSEEQRLRLLRNTAKQMGLTEEQVINLPYYPLVELMPVDGLDRLAVRHFGIDAGMPPNRNVAAVVRTSSGDMPVTSAHILETSDGRLRMIMDASVLRTVITDEITKPVPFTIREATLGDCEELTRQIIASPDSRY